MSEIQIFAGGQAKNKRIEGCTLQTSVDELIDKAVSVCGYKESEVYWVHNGKPLNKGSDRTLMDHCFQKNINFIYPGFRLLGGAWTAKFRNDESGATSSHEISADMTGKELLTKAGFDSSLSISLVGRSGVKSIDKDKKLVDQGIQNNQSGTFVVSKGSFQKSDGYDLVQGANVFSNDNSVVDNLYKMDCGHNVDPSGMTLYLKNQIKVLQQSKFDDKIRCPMYNDEAEACPGIWDTELCIKLAKPTDKEMEEFSFAFTKIYFQVHMNAIQCTVCQSFCTNVDKKIRVRCPICVENGKGREFCVNCLQDWSPVASNVEICSRQECDPEVRFADLLQNCARKKIGNMENAPSRRLCPKCSTLLEHDRGCKLFQCPCKHYFCFVCLADASSKTTTTCGNKSYDGICQVAPIQGS